MKMVINLILLTSVVSQKPSVGVEVYSDSGKLVQVVSLMSFLQP